MKHLLFCSALTAILATVTIGPAMAGSTHDGAWSLNFVTQRGACDRTYNFDVNISNGNVSHPNLVKFKGRVTPSGLVHASVAVGDKYASGSGTMSQSNGRGTWNGLMGSARCSGYWTAQRT